MKSTTSPPERRDGRTRGHARDGVRAATRRRGVRAFTLLEVLAAVAVLGLWYVVLAHVAAQGARAEGGNDRRIQASLIADDVLAQLEMELEDGVFPEASEEPRDDLFTVSIEPVGIADTDVDRDEDDLVPFLAAELPTLLPSLIQVRVAVSWQEGARTMEVQRTTYAWDDRDVQAMLEGIDTGAADTGGAAEGTGAEAGQTGSKLPELPAPQ